MADIGRSSAAHVSERYINFPDGHEALDNWAAWYRSADYGISTSIGSSMFRNMENGYRESSGLRTTYDGEYAIETDRLMAKLLSPGDLDMIFLG